MQYIYVYIHTVYVNLNKHYCIYTHLHLLVVYYLKLFIIIILQLENYIINFHLDLVILF